MELCLDGGMTFLNKIELNKIGRGNGHDSMRFFMGLSSSIIICLGMIGCSGASIDNNNIKNSALIEQGNVALISNKNDVETTSLDLRSRDGYPILGVERPQQERMLMTARETEDMQRQLEQLRTQHEQSLMTAKDMEKYRRIQTEMERLGKNHAQKRLTAIEADQ